MREHFDSVPCRLAWQTSKLAVVRTLWNVVRQTGGGLTDRLPQGRRHQQLLFEIEGLSNKFRPVRRSIYCQLR